MLLLLVAAGCSPDTVQLGDFFVEVDPKSGGLRVDRKGREVLDLQRLELGQGDAEIQFAVGSYLFEEQPTTWLSATSLKVRHRQDGISMLADLRDEDGREIAGLTIWQAGADLLGIQVIPYQGIEIEGEAPNRARATMGCTEGGPFLGTGGHQLDVDHQGEAFSLWVAEPGIGKVEDDVPPEDWFITGTRHATSYPLPFLLRPELPMGLLASTWARVDLDLCASDPDRYQVGVWEGALSLFVIGGDDALQVVENQAMSAGGVAVPPDVAFGPWNDAIHGAERVAEVARTLREAGAPTALIWTEDWKGGAETGFGYHLSLDWYLDETLYPDAEGIAQDLRASGFEWLAYFSPFVGEETRAFEEASHLLMQTADGEPYLWSSATLEQTGGLDLSDSEARAWAQERMDELIAVGFTGWMADFAEWIPPDAVLKNADPIDQHNAYTLWWQQTNAEALADIDATWFTRSGWISTPAISPITWGGDQRTSFDTDDGFPTVIPLGLGLSIGGVAFYGHDIAGYNSIGNEPTSKELWFRWAWLGAFSPIMRTHHGAFAEDNHQFDSDEETLAHWVRTATEHSRLFPYLKGLAQLAQDSGRPLLLHPALVYPGYDWARGDAWLLGSAIFVAPVLEEGATGREIVLPPGDWYDWWTGQPVSSGWFAAEADEIPVFAAGGSVVPLLAEAPETFVSGTALRDLAAVDGARVLRVFGTGGRFSEADGTRYTVSGTASAAGAEEVVLSSGSVDINGLTVEIQGEVERSYRVEVQP